MSSRDCAGCVLWGLVGLLALALGVVVALLWAGSRDPWPEAEL